MTRSVKPSGLLRLMLASSILASALAMPLSAEEGPAPENPHELGLSDRMDPYLRRDVVSLRETGVIDLQGQIGTELLVLERLQRRADALRALMERLGTDGIRQLDPELHESLSQSPIFLQQRIAELNLQIQLMELMEKEKDALREEEEAERISEARSDGSDFFQPPEPRPQVVDLPELEPEPEPVVVAEPVIVDFPISLREIFGSQGDLRAIIAHGDEFIRVSPGDELPNDTQIINILEDRIVVRRRDRVFDIHLRG